jgi:hypothetical protein
MSVTEQLQSSSVRSTRETGITAFPHQVAAMKLVSYFPLGKSQESKKNAIRAVRNVEGIALRSSVGLTEEEARELVKSTFEQALLVLDDSRLRRSNEGLLTHFQRSRYTDSNISRWRSVLNEVYGEKPQEVTIVERPALQPVPVGGVVFQPNG